MMLGFMVIVFISSCSLVVGDTTESDCNTFRKSHQITVEDRAKYSPLVLHTLAVYTNPSNVSELANRTSMYSAHFWLIKVYKGASEMARYFQIDDTDDVAVFNIHDRKINVTEFYRPAVSISNNLCWKPITSQKYYILFAALRNGVLTAFNDDIMGAYEEWSEEREAEVERGLGWSPWTDWGPCTVTCGEGIQERQRNCMDSFCAGYNKQRRFCNLFSCEGTVEPLAMDKQKYFHPSSLFWEKVPERKNTWRIKPSYYLWLPATEVAFPVADFQKHFSLIVSIRVDPTVRKEGTIFSLRSRSQPNTFLSLNLDGPDILRIIQSSPNKTQSVVIPAAIADGHWHQLALGIEDNVSVRSYLDCRWVSTDILRNNSLAETEDADLIIGYLFSGDLQLILVPDSGAVVQQCSTWTISILDKDLLKDSSSKSMHDKTQLRRRHRPVPEITQPILTDWKIKTNSELLTQPIDDSEDRVDADLMSDDEDADRKQDDGSGDGPIFRMEWSSWSGCSTSCGVGFRTRHLQCINSIGNDEPCPITETEHVEKRPCKLKSCKVKTKSGKARKISHNHKIDDFSDNFIDLDQKKFKILQKHRIHEEDLNDIKACKCVNGGICDKNFDCICSQSFTGSLCEIPKLETCELNIKCRNGGTCIGDKCSCPQGYTGNDCSSHLCGTGCLNDGVCVEFGVCKCPPNVTGSSCEIVHCNPPCENGATCTLDNECLCTPSMTSPRCAEKKCHYIAVRKPFTVGVRRLARQQFSPHCARNTAECASRLVPKFQTVYRTVHRTIYECADSSSISFS